MLRSRAALESEREARVRGRRRGRSGLRLGGRVRARERGRRARVRRLAAGAQHLLDGLEERQVQQVAEAGQRENARDREGVPARCRVRHARRGAPGGAKGEAVRGPQCVHYLRRGGAREERLREDRSVGALSGERTRSEESTARDLSRRLPLRNQHLRLFERVAPPELRAAHAAGRHVPSLQLSLEISGSEHKVFEKSKRVFN